MSTSSANTILLIEDNPTDARLVDVLLRTMMPRQFRCVWVESLVAALDKMATQRFAAALLDLNLDDSSGLETLARLRAAAPTLPIVVLTGTDDEEVAVRAVQQGAQDYLVKGQGGAESIRRAIRHAIERSQQDANLRRSEERFRAVFENAGLGIGLIDRNGRLFSANPVLRGILGDEDADLSARQFLDFIHFDDRPHVQAFLEPLLAGGCQAPALEIRFGTGAHPAWGRLTLSQAGGTADEPRFAVAVVEDVTARKAMEDKLRLAAKVFEATSEGIFLTDATRRIIHVNPAFARLTGFTPEDVLGRKPSLLSSGRHGKEYYAAMWRALLDEGFWRGEIWNRKKNGELFAAWLNISVVQNESGAVANYVAVFSDITTRKRSEERLHHQASHDPLTGLPNRTLFLERLERALARAQRNHLVVAVLFLDIDRFKQINDSLGHLAGDALLQQVAERLASSVRREDTVARLGGDEFTLIIEDIDDFRDAATVAQKILRQFGRPFSLDGDPHTVSTSIGIALFPTDGRDVAGLLQQADTAMYTAKKQGRDSFRFASTDHSHQAFQRQTMEAALRRTLESGGLEIHYQPIIDLKSNRVVSAEAFLRWRHPELGLMMPGQFLPLAKEAGLMGAVGAWVLRTAFADAAAWRQAPHADVRLSINVSRTELHAPDFLDVLRRQLAEAGLPAAAVDVEIPEILAMEDAPATRQIVEALHKLGCRVALDDFGAGGTDFRALRHWPIDVLKISPAFVHALDIHADDARLVRTATALAHSLHVNVVAKSVETTRQYEFLRQHRCDAAQGFLFSRPVPAAELPPLLAMALVEEGVEP